MQRPFSVAIITVSDRAAAGERDDCSGPELAQLVTRRLGCVVETSIVPDDRPAIEAQLIKSVDGLKVDLVLTTGGTGVSPRDITPDVTRDLVDREVPGVAELMRLEGRRYTPMAMISRAICGIRGHSVILNLPGSPKGAVENLEAVMSLLPHLIEKVQGDPSDCAQPAARSTAS